MDEKMKWLLSAFLGVLSAFTQQYGAMIILVAVAIVFDLATGLVKAGIAGTVSSKVGTKGLLKKFALLLCLLFGFFLDYSIEYMCQYIRIDIPFSLPFGMIICFYIVLNECISICENLYSCNPNIMPKWIVNVLRTTKDKFDDVEDGGSDGKNVSKE